MSIGQESADGVEVRMPSSGPRLLTRTSDRLVWRCWPWARALAHSSAPLDEGAKAASPEAVQSILPRLQVDGVMPDQWARPAVARPSGANYNVPAATADLEVWNR